MRRAALLGTLALLVGCSPTDPAGTPDDDSDASEADDDTTGGPADDDDTSEAPPVAFDLQWALSECIPTVVEVAWSVDAEAVDEAWVEFGAEFGLSVSANGTPDGPFDAIVVGLDPGSTTLFRAVVSVDGHVHRSEEVAVETGSPPVDLPLPTLTALDEDLATGGLIATSIVSSPSYAVLLDREGDVVWWHAPDATWDVTFVPRVALSRDGRSVIYLATPLAVVDDDPKEQQLVRVSLDGCTEEITTVEGAHHDFEELPDGTLALIHSDVRDVEGEPVDGDQVIELGMDGEPTQAFSVWDHLDYEPLDTPWPTLGWTHANALDYLEDEDAYLLSLHNLHTLLKVDRGSGELLWRLGGEESDFALPDGSTDLFYWQHEFTVADEQVLVFDNGGWPEPYSRVVQYTVDEAAGSVEQQWEHQTDPPMYVYCLGEALWLPSGHVLTSWGTSGRIDEVTAEGEVVKQLDLPLGATFGYIQHVDAPYQER